MVAYHYDFRIALEVPAELFFDGGTPTTPESTLNSGSPTPIAANSTVLVYDPADTAYITPLTVYADPALTIIINLVSDANGVVPSFWTNNKPDLLWKSGEFEGSWPTTSSRPGLQGPVGPPGVQGIQGVQGLPGLNGAGTNAEVAAYVNATGETRTALDGRYTQSALLDSNVAEKIDTAGTPTRLAVDARVNVAKAVIDADVDTVDARVTAVNTRVDAIDTSVPNVRMFGNWKTERNAALAKTRPVVALVGDSIGKKFNASSIANSWAGKMTTELQTLKGDGGTGFRGMADAGYAGGTFLSGFWDQYADIDKVTLSGSAWANSTNAAFIYNGPGYTMGACSTVGATATFRVVGTTISVYYLGVTTVGGTFTATVDGVATGGTVNVGSRASDATAKTVLTTTASAGVHTVVITLASGGLNLFGVSGENTTGLIVNNFSKGGVTATAIMGGANAGADWNGGPNYPADLLIYALGINDLATTDVNASQVADHARKFLARLRDQGNKAPVLMVVNHAGKRDTVFRHVAVSARLREVAESYKGAFVDLWGKYQNSWTEANTASYWGSTTTIGITGTDDVHLSDTGHTAAWDTIRQALI